MTRVEPFSMYNALTEHYVKNTLETTIDSLLDGRIYVPANESWPLNDPNGKEGLESKEFNGIAIFHNGPRLLEKMFRDGYIYRMRDKEGNLKKKVEGTILNHNDAVEYFKNFTGDGILLYDSGSGDVFRAKNINGKYIDLSEKFPIDFIHSVRPEGYDIEDFESAFGNKGYVGTAVAEQYPGLNFVSLKQSKFGRLRLGKVFKVDAEGLKNERFFTYFDKNHPEYSPELYSPKSSFNQNEIKGMNSGILGIERSYHPTEEGVERDGPDRIFYHKPVEMPCESPACMPVFGYNKARPSLVKYA